jgi:hypothetical protein
MSAITTAVEHIISRLNSAGTSDLVDGRVFQGVAPVDSKYPFILIQSYGDTFDYLGVGKPSAGSVVEILVRVIGVSSTLSSIEAIQNSVANALHSTFGVNSRGTVSSCVSIGESELAENDGTAVIRYLGNRFRLLIN